MINQDVGYSEPNEFLEDTEYEIVHGPIVDMHRATVTRLGELEEQVDAARTDIESWETYPSDEDPDEETARQLSMRCDALYDSIETIRNALQTVGATLEEIAENAPFSARVHEEYLRRQQERKAAEDQEAALKALPFWKRIFK